MVLRYITSILKLYSILAHLYYTLFILYKNINIFALHFNVISRLIFIILTFKSIKSK